MDPEGGNKRIIVCCDGTWQDADSGYTKPSPLRGQPYGILQVPSNVVRISRALRREDVDGRPQIVYYQTGVGTGISGKISGGLLGTGISNNIREAYAFITTNYVPGDDIVLIGFSRGAFTVRSVAGLIKNIGLLTRHGMEYFYAIFKDNQNSRNPEYHDIFPDIPFRDKPPPGSGPEGVRRYRRRLEAMGYTRVAFGKPRSYIDVQAIAVWDTVGSLGIPTLGWMQKMGFPEKTKELKFFDTSLSSNVRHAFQALALDEHRAPFSPAVWERRDEDDCDTDLRQVWFAGAHSNCGGGYSDQNMANVSLCWMMDQLASIGLEFDDRTVEKIFQENKQFYLNPPPQPKTLSALFKRKPLEQWAIPEVYRKHEPVRPWALGEIFEAETGIYHLTGFALRTPGKYCRADPETGHQTNEYMRHTHERVHRSVRIRLELDGLDVDDSKVYQCRSLFEQGWDLRQRKIKVKDPVPYNADWGGLDTMPSPPGDLRWVWEYVGPREERPLIRTMVEESIGPYERRLLLLSKDNEREDEKPRRRRRRRPKDE